MLLKKIWRKIPKLFCTPPTFMVLGVQKGGTTALYNLINQHPLIQVNATKETYFFTDEFLYKKGISWYHSYFFSSKFPNNKITFDATPAYLVSNQSPKRLYHYNQNLKFIIVLRDPVYRAYSAWNMYKQFHNNLPERLRKVQNRKIVPPDAKEIIDFFLDVPRPPSFEETINFEIQNMNTRLQPSIIRTGFYVNHLIRYFDFFDKNQFKILTDQDCLNNTQHVLDDIFTFLELPPITLSEKKLQKRYHKREYQEVISIEMEEKLRQLYQPYDVKLKNLLKRDFYWIK